MLYIFLFNRKILTAYSRVIFVVCILCFITAYLLQHYNVKGGEALKIPLLHFILLKFFYSTFKYIYDREPKDSYWTMDKSLMTDGIFNALFWVVSVVIPPVIVFNNWI